MLQTEVKPATETTGQTPQTTPNQSVTGGHHSHRHVAHFTPVYPGWASGTGVNSGVTR